MSQFHEPAELPRDATDEERIELERGRGILRAMVALVQKARHRPERLTRDNDGSHE